MAGNPERDLLNSVYSEVVRMMRSREFSPTEIMKHIHERTGGVYDVLPERGAITNTHVLQSMQRINQRSAQIESTPDVAGGMAMAALNGASFGFADELVGIFSKENRDELRRQTQAFRGEHPVMSLAGEAAGGLLVPGLGSIQALRGGRTLRGALGAGALIGGVEGAAVGYGEANTEDFFDPERLVGAGVGGAVGAVGGAALGGLLHGGRAAWRNITGRTGRSVEEEARAVAQDIAGQSPRGVEGVVSDFERMQKLNPEAVLADVPEMRPVARAAATASPEARAVAQEVLPPRARAARERVERNLLEGIGEEVPESTLQRRARLRQRFQQGSQAYTELVNTVTDVPGDAVKQAMVREGGVVHDVIHDAWNNANRIAKRSGEPLVQLFERQGDDVVLTGANPDFRTLQAMKQSLDDEVGHLFSLRRPNEARSVANVRDDFYGAVLDEVSNYGPAQRNWMGMIEEEKAITQGMDFMKKNPREIVTEIQSLSPNAQQAYKEAAIESITDKLRSQIRRGDVSRVFDSADMEERLHLLFPDEASFQRFLDQLDVEREFASTTNQLLGGSATAESLNLAQRLRQTGAGAEFLQRASIIPVAPGIGVSRIAADVQAGRLAAGAQRRATEVGGSLGSSLLGRGASASNLLRGPTGSIRPGLFTDYVMRSPRALLLALTGN